MPENKDNPMKKKKILSYFRRLYQGRFVLRCALLFISAALLIFAPGQYDIMHGFHVFDRFSFFHVMWLLWMFDMVMQLIPAKRYWPVGSQKFLKQTFQPLKDYMKRNDEKFISFIIKSNRDTLLIGLVWLALNGCIAALYFTGIIGRRVLLLISVVFYVCDLICVLFWCPFRVWFMKNRCCTTCRIFNWDHIMMFTPLLFVPGVYTWSLCAVALVIFVIWEITFQLHPERFWEGTNSALRCSNCTDRICGERNCAADFPEMR